MPDLTYLTKLDPARLELKPGLESMKAVVTTGNGDYDRLDYRDVPIPQIGPGEVLLKVLAAGVNNTEINTRLGWYSSSVDSGTEQFPRVIVMRTNSRMAAGTRRRLFHLFRVLIVAVKWWHVQTMSTHCRSANGYWCVPVCARRVTSHWKISGWPRILTVPLRNT
jgi:hypothetical protein